MGKARLLAMLRNDAAAMTSSTRKLYGTLLMLALLIVYPIIGMLVFVTFLEGAPWWVAILYAALAGLLWAVPAAIIIRWMARP